MSEIEEQSSNIIYRQSKVIPSHLLCAGITSAQMHQWHEPSKMGEFHHFNSLYAKPLISHRGDGSEGQTPSEFIILVLKVSTVSLVAAAKKL